MLRAMQLKARTINELAEMVTGGSGGGGMFGGSNGERARVASAFPYRSSSALTLFFKTCDTDYVHGGGSRVPWTEEKLAELNKGPSSRPDLPADLM